MKAQGPRLMIMGLCMTEVFRNTGGDLSARWDRLSAARVKLEGCSCIDLQ